MVGLMLLVEEIITLHYCLFKLAPRALPPWRTDDFLSFLRVLILEPDRPSPSEIFPPKWTELLPPLYHPHMRGK